MKFNNLTINNFKGIESLSYVPQNKIAILMGNNGKGKTSTLESIRYLLTGNAPENFIRTGTNSAIVSAYIDGIGEVSREKPLDKPSKVRINGKVTPAKNLDPMFETACGVNKDELKITTSADIVNGLSSAEFSDFIMRYIKDKLDLQIICNYITNLTPEGEKELAEFFPAMPQKFTIDMIYEAQKYYTETRKFLKKEIADREIRIKSYSEEKPTRTLFEIEAELNSLIAADGGLDASRKAIEMYNIAVTNRKNAENDLSSLLVQINAISASKPNPETLKKIRKEIAYYNDQIISANRILQTIKNNIDLFTETINNLNKPFCPLSERITCTTDKSKIKAEFEANLMSNKEGLKIQEDIISQNEGKIKELKIKENEYLKNESEYNKKVVLTSRYENAKKAMPTIPTRPETIEIKDYKIDIARVQKERDMLKAYEEKEKLINEKEKLKERLDLICFLLEALESKGEVMKSIMTYYMSYFETSINTRADELKTGIKIKFIAEEGVHFLVQVDKQIGFLPYASLSHGEQTVAMFLLLDMLSKLSGTKLLLLDDLNHLDPTALETLMALITSAPVQKDYDHIFISSVNTTDMVNVVTKYAANVDQIF